MGMYDIVVIKCRNCGKETNSQTKILGGNEMKVLKIGSEIWNDELANCILKLKNKCGCGSENAIKIKDKKIVSVERPNNADCVEELWGSYKFIIDELTQTVKEKLKKIEDETKRKNRRD